MKRYAALRWARVVVSVAVFLALTLLWTEYSGLFAGVFGWVGRTQIITAGAVAASTFTVAFWLLATWLFGRVYCSSVCPLGTWFDIVGRIGLADRRAMGRVAHYRYSPALTRVRYGVLAVAVVCMVAGLAFLPLLIEPTSIYSRFVTNALKPLWGVTCNLLERVGAATGWWSTGYVEVALAGVFGTALAVVSMIAVSIPAWLNGRTYCNSVCPIGTALGIVSRNALWRIDIDTDLCTNCGRCEDVCKASCIDLRGGHTVDSSRCVNCFDCLTVCPSDAIFYRPTRKQLSLPMMQAIQPPKLGQAAGESAQTAMENTIVNPSEPNTTQ